MKIQSILFTVLIGILLVCPMGASARVLKIATISPEGSMWMKKMRQGAKRIARETDNRVKFKFYPGGVMGNDRAVIRKIRIGQLHGGAVVGGSLSSFFPANQIYSQPMKFASMDEVDHVRTHLDTFIMDGLDKAGFVTFGISGGGFAYIMSKEPVETVEDLKHRKVWIPDNDKLSQESVKAFGVNPIPLPLADVRTALQSGLIDTVATSPIGAVVLQWHTQIKYVTDIPLIFLHAVLAIDKKKFMKIPLNDRLVVTREMTRVFRAIDRQNRADDLKAVDALKNRGIQFLTPAKNSRREWLDLASSASAKMVEAGVLPKDVVKEMDRLLEEVQGKATP